MEKPNSTVWTHTSDTCTLPLKHAHTHGQRHTQKARDPRVGPHFELGQVEPGYVKPWSRTLTLAQVTHTEGQAGRNHSPHSNNNNQKTKSCPR